MAESPECESGVSLCGVGVEVVDPNDVAEVKEQQRDPNPCLKACADESGPSKNSKTHEDYESEGASKYESEDAPKYAKLLFLSISVVFALLTFCCILALFVQTSDLKALVSTLNQKISSLNQNMSSLSQAMPLLQQNDSGNTSVTCFDDSKILQLNTTIAGILARMEEGQEAITRIEERQGDIADSFNRHEDELSSVVAQQQIFGQQIFSIYHFTSCADFPPSIPSGYYWLRASNDSAVHVYCDMTRSSCSNDTGGWQRVADLNMTNSSHQCPSGFRQRNDFGIRTCVMDTDWFGCASVTFPTFSVEYSRVCGKIVAYQFGTPEPFYVIGGDNSTDRHYVNGVSLTHGSPRQHIWTFAAGPDDLNTGNRGCPCINRGGYISPPRFVEDNYFCDTGSPDEYTLTFYADDPLWDGAGCGPLSDCCTFNNPPWFHRELPQATTDDIEMRVCRDQLARNEDTPLQSVEIYVQ